MNLKFYSKMRLSAWVCDYSYGIILILKQIPIDAFTSCIFSLPVVPLFNLLITSLLLHFISTFAFQLSG